MIIANYWQGTANALTRRLILEAFCSFQAIGGVGGYGQGALFGSPVVTGTGKKRMTAGDIGTTIICNAGGYDMTGATAVIIATPGSFSAPGQPIILSPVTISADGRLGLYDSTGLDITAGGWWEFRLQVVPNTGGRFTSPPDRQYIFPL